jgi:hypothetical protein
MVSFAEIYLGLILWMGVQAILSRSEVCNGYESISVFSYVDRHLLDVLSSDLALFRLRL